MNHSKVELNSNLQGLYARVHGIFKKSSQCEQDLIDFSQFYLPPVNGSNLIGRNIQLRKKVALNTFNWEVDSRKVIKGFQWSEEEGGAVLTRAQNS